MSWLDALAILVAGIGAGTINAIVGSGTLLTFPTLLALGIPPVVANISNTVGLVPGSVTAVHGYRAEMVGAGRDLRRLVPASVLGGAAGAFLLLNLDAGLFSAIVPVLIGVGVLLVVFGPALTRATAGTHHGTGPDRMPVTQVATAAAGIYGGYFGAAQGVILMGIFGVLLDQSIQRSTGYKNVCAAVVNVIAALTFAIVAWGEIRWDVVALLAVGSIVGAMIGSTVGRRIPPTLLRAVIAVVGIAAIVALVWFR